MKPHWLLVGLLVLSIPATAAMVLTRDLVSAGGAGCAAGPITLSGSVGGYAFGACTAAPDILLIEGFWFPTGLDPAGLETAALAQYPFRLDQNFPNPCRGLTAIRYSVPGSGKGAVPVRIEIFDVQGRRIAILADAPQAPGQYTTHWTGLDPAGRSVPAGVYYCSLRAAGTTAFKTLVVLK
jgi:hypothetical protein